jgi:hypothetical protein
VTMSAGIVMYCVREFLLCRIFVRTLTTMRFPPVKPCGGSIEKDAAGEGR